MAASLNKVTLIGNMGQAPELRYTGDGTPVVSFSLATTESWKDKGTGERREQTEWHRCEAWGRLAEIIGQYGDKGSHVYLEGSLKTDKYTDKDGVERYTTKIRMQEFKFLGARRSGEQSGDTGHGGMDDMGGDAGGDAPAAAAPSPAPARAAAPAAAPAAGGARARFANRGKPAATA